MARYTAKDVIKVEIPDGFEGSLVVRCVEKEFGESKSSGQPMITSKWEVLGVKNTQGGVDDHIIRDGKKYVIGGLNTNKVYHSLSAKALSRHQEFWSKATGRPEEEYDIDTENPDTSYYDNLVMTAHCQAQTIERTKKLTEEEKDALRDAGKPLVGEKMTDEEGNPLPPLKLLAIVQFNRKFSGDLPQF